mmetsp:Transcript_21253/g.38149  ORF Transcript_21253/g.38149 Transcript_21253/m.38149 type:complete len:222 (+) Transcript_21253:587-1252(+)
MLQCMDGVNNPSGIQKWLLRGGNTRALACSVQAKCCQHHRWRAESILFGILDLYWGVWQMLLTYVVYTTNGANACSNGFVCATCRSTPCCYVTCTQTARGAIPININENPFCVSKLICCCGAGFRAVGVPGQERKVLITPPPKKIAAMRMVATINLATINLQAGDKNLSILAARKCIFPSFVIIAQSDLLGMAPIFFYFFLCSGVWAVRAQGKALLGMAPM